MSPNQKIQCDYCAFYVKENQSTFQEAENVEARYKILNKLSGYTKHHIPRHMIVSVGSPGPEDETTYCLIKSKYWKTRKEVYCEDNMSTSFSLETTLDLREARLANKLAEESNKRADASNSLAEEANTLSKESNDVAREANDFAREANSLARKASRRALLANIIPIIAVIITAITAKAEIKWFISWVINLFTPPLIG